MEKVKSKMYLNKYKVYENGMIYSIAYKRWIKPNKNTKNKYQFYRFPNPEGKKVKVYVHRLIAELFIENPLSLKCVNHKDGDKNNNSVENLEYCTYLQNMEHAVKMGLIDSKLTIEQVRTIRYEEMQVPTSTLAKKYGISYNAIYNLKKGISWKHV